MPKQRVPQIFTLIRFYVDPLILIPSIQHEKSDYLFQDNRFFLSDPPGARTQGNYSIFRHDNFIGCFSADKIKMSARK